MYLQLITLLYLCGSVPFGLLVTKLFITQDITRSGSGNIGATNVTRVAGKTLGAITLILDFSKSLVPLLIVQKYYPNPDFLPILGVASILGHIFPIWRNFKGGKGVATTLGFYFAHDLLIGSAASCIWLIVFITTKYSSLASILMVITTAIIAIATYPFTTAYIFIIIAIIIIITHKANILRIIKGQEHKF